MSLNVGAERIINRVPGWLSSQEIAFIAAQAKQMDSWLEVGVYCGRSAICAGLHLRKNACLILVDNRLGEWHEGGQCLATSLATLRCHRPDLRIIQCHAASAEAVRFIDRVDAVFIDGEHSYESCRDDIANWFPKSDKLICGHDYSESWSGVIKAVDEFFPSSAEHCGTIWFRKNK